MKAERTHGNKRASRAAWVPLNWGVCTASTRSLAVFARLSARLRSVESVGWMAAMRLGTARARARQKLTEQSARRETAPHVGGGKGTTHSISCGKIANVTIVLRFEESELSIQDCERGGD